VDPVARARGTLEDLPEKDHLVVPFADGDAEVGDVVVLFGESGEFVVVGGEEGPWASVGEVFGDGPGEGQAVEGAGATADFVEDDEAGGRGVVADVGGLGHLDHEGGLTSVQFVAGADAGEDAVAESDGGLFGGDEAAGVGEEGDEGGLSDVGGFAGHIGSGD
jgi:hypothetical protein